jgi:hypothetical protein
MRPLSHNPNLCQVDNPEIMGNDSAAYGASRQSGEQAVPDDVPVWVHLVASLIGGVVGGPFGAFIYFAFIEKILAKQSLHRDSKHGRGRRLGKHHQLLTDDIGHPALAQHLHAVIGLMRASSNWRQFHDLLDRAFPKKGSVLQLELISDDNGTS